MGTATAILAAVNWVEVDGPSIRFRLIQFNIRQVQKFDPDYVAQEIATLGDLMTAAPTDVAIAPETALPVYFHKLPPAELGRLERFSAASETHLMIGVPTIGSHLQGHNSVLHIAPEAPRLRFLNKIGLMPFGEYDPPGFGWFSRSLHMPLKDLQPGGTDQLPFRVRGARFGSIICHEDLTASVSRLWAPKVGVLINPSNLAWFEHSLAIPQRVQIVQARALEVGRPVLRVANTGISAHVDHLGRILQRLPPDMRGVLVGEVQPMRGETPYARLGDWPLLATCVALVALSLAISRAGAVS